MGEKTTKQRAGNEFGNIAQAPTQRAIAGQGELADGILQGQRLLRDRIIAAARRQKNIDCSNIYRCYCCCSSSFGKRSNTGQLARPNTEGASEEVPNGVCASRVQAGRVNYYSAQFVHPGPALLFVCQGCFDWMSLARHPPPRGECWSWELGVAAAKWSRLLKKAKLNHFTGGFVAVCFAHREDFPGINNDLRRSKQTILINMFQGFFLCLCLERAVC